MTTVGFKQVYVAIFDNEEDKVKDLMLWKDEDGGTVNMNLSGLAPEVVEMRASNKTVWQKKQGTGEVKSDMGLFNIPDEDLNKVLGRKVDNNGTAWVGDNTRAPHVAMIGESEDLNGVPIFCALTKGTLSLESIEWKTTEKKQNAPEPTKLTGDWLARTIDNESRIVGFHKGATKKSDFFSKVFPGYEEIQKPNLQLPGSPQNVEVEANAKSASVSAE